LFPEQGDWTEEEYLNLPGNRLVEFSNGYLEFLPMPKTSHQWIVLLLYRLLHEFAWPELGTPLVAPLRLRLWRGKFREPDLLFVLKKHESWIGEDFWTGADLVMEVVSADAKSRKRDLLTKRREYARSRIAEYWIVDPENSSVTVFYLKGKKYERLGKFASGTRVESRLLPGFSVDVAEIFSGRTS
jgi:Uma2 family endonuclease